MSRLTVKKDTRGKWRWTLKAEAATGSGPTVRVTSLKLTNIAARSVPTTVRSFAMFVNTSDPPARDC
ncbi:hypothetical protein LCGC14_1781560 [marine sediment metagenome]|uniref:Uncharacterized protein n=1 Tax=marine sediment metagenome TaxID=412755 RepID=A0A0F9JA66_9ZZZZ